MYRLSFLSSGSGNLTETILLAIKQGVLKKVTPVSIISDRDSPSLKLAPKYDLKSHKIAFGPEIPREISSNEILKIYENEGIDFSFSTFDRIVSGKIVEMYKNKLINMHPSLLPSFPGYNTVAKAREYGCKYIGATCHFIDDLTDHGPIINQAVMPFYSQESEKKILDKLYRLRQKLALEAIYAFSHNLIKTNGRNVIITDADYNQYPINPSLNISAIDKFLKNYEK